MAHSARPRTSSRWRNKRNVGFDSVWVNDHVHFTHERMRRSSSGVADAQGQPDPNYFESLTTLAAVAGRCEKIWIGVHGLILPIRDPRLFAKQVATIHELSGGRLIISPAIGGFREDFALMQVPFERRGRHLLAVKGFNHKIERASASAPLQPAARGRHPKLQCAFPA